MIQCPGCGCRFASLLPRTLVMMLPTSLWLVLLEAVCNCTDTLRQCREQWIMGKPVFAQCMGYVPDLT